jgi:predicted nucleic acid-binding protein
MSTLDVPLFYLDANIIIYAIEHPFPRSEAQHALLTALDQGSILACTSELSFVECLVAPIASNKLELISLYMEFLTNRPHFQVLPIDRWVLMTAAELRATARSTLADSIHVATALKAGATNIITNDKKIRLPKGVSKLGWEELQWSHS